MLSLLKSPEEEISPGSDSSHLDIKPSSPESLTVTVAAGPCRVAHCPCSSGSFATSGGPIADISCLQCHHPFCLHLVRAPAPTSTEPLLLPSKFIVDSLYSPVPPPPPHQTPSSDPIQHGALGQLLLLVFTTGFLSTALYLYAGPRRRARRSLCISSTAISSNETPISRSIPFSAGRRA